MWFGVIFGNQDWVNMMEHPQQTISEKLTHDLDTCQWYVHILEMFKFCCAPTSPLGPCPAPVLSLFKHPPYRLVLGRAPASLRRLWRQEARPGFDPTRINSWGWLVCSLFSTPPSTVPNVKSRCASFLQQDKHETEKLTTCWVTRILPLRMSIFCFAWGSKISRFPGSQVSKFPDSQTPAPAHELSDPNLTPLPMHPGIKYVGRFRDGCIRKCLHLEL